MDTIPFTQLSLSAELQQAITAMGFEEATPIQSVAIPVLLAGHDVIGQAQTGTGKTLAFGVPILEAIQATTKAVQALVLCPTRELAVQVTNELLRLARYKSNLKIVPIYGGQSIDRQFRSLDNHPQIIVGTPGRVLDHLERKSLSLSQISHFVLDEADEMLNMGFQDEIEAILEQIPAERQTILFSATMPPAILKLTKRFMRDPQVVKVLHESVTVPEIEQFYLETREAHKIDVLCRLLDVHAIKLGLVFCNRKTRVDELVAQLQSRGYLADALHGDMRQAQRDQVMRKLRTGHLDILVATDVAARGLDIPDVEAVFNFDFPYDEENYVHRIGRTGRAGKSGKAFTLVVGREGQRVKQVQKYTRMPMRSLPIPDFEQVQNSKVQGLLEQLQSEMAETDQLKPYLQIAADLVSDSDFSTMELAAALLKRTLKLDPRAYPDLYQPAAPAYAKTSSQGMVRLFVNVGHRDRVRPGDLVGAIAGETGLAGRSIGEIEIHDTFSFVDIPAGEHERVIEGMKGVSVRGRPIMLQVATPASGKVSSERSFATAEKPISRLKKLRDFKHDKTAVPDGLSARAMKKKGQRDQKGRGQR